MIKAFAILGMILVGVSAEPPVESSYLPPRHRSNPSNQYGAPHAGGYNNFRLAGSSYLPPSNNLNNEESAADKGNSFGSQQPSPLTETYGAPFQQQKSENLNSDSVTVDSALNTNSDFSFRQPNFGYSPSKEYESSTYASPSSTYGAPNSFSNELAEGRALGPASSRFRSFSRPSFNNEITSAKFGRPSRPNFRSNDFSSSSTYSPRANTAVNTYSSDVPSSTYGTPFSSGFSDNLSARLGGYNARANYNGYSRQFEGYPRKTTTEDPLSEPAVYEYKYEVQAADEFGAQFGHKENRENEAARGEYHVLLPDGRMQIVEYQADESGYRPQIRYEETGYPAARAEIGGY